jgi:aspartate-semialdehyde dehydrogenase
MIKVGIIGGTGYTGVKLLRLLARHPRVELSAVISRGEARGFTIGGAGSWRCYCDGTNVLEPVCSQRPSPEPDPCCAAAITKNPYDFRY